MTNLAILKLLISIIGSMNLHLKLRRQLLMQQQKTIKYICSKCHAEELIPQEVIDYFDSIDLERALVGPPSFQCERCSYPYMLPKQHSD